MKSWLILVWLLTFAGWDWLNGVEGDELPASNPQVADRDPTGGEEAKNKTHFLPHPQQDDITDQEAAPQTKDGPKQALGKGAEKGAEMEEQEILRGVVQAEPKREECEGCQATYSVTEGEEKVNGSAGAHDLGQSPEGHRVQSTEDGAKELDKKPDIIVGTKVAKEQDKEPTKECDKDPDKELAKEQDKEPTKECDKDPDKELAKEQDKEPTKECDMDPDKELAKEQDKVPTKECDKDPNKDLAKEQDKELTKECDKEPTATPTSEATTAPTLAPQRCPLSNPWDTCEADFREESPRVAMALTDFSLKFYSAVAKVKGTNTNMVFSPLSVALALSHLLLGARGETKERLESILAYPPDLACPHAPLGHLTKSKALSIASNLFLRQDLQVNNAFLNQSLHFYGSRPHMLTGNETHDLRQINKWVKEMTHGKIKKLLKELEPDVQLVLLNAIYFQSKWKTTFKIKNTVMEKFYRQDQAPIQVPMMTSKKYPLAFFTDYSLQAKVGRLQLSHNMSMVVFVPQSPSQTLAEVLQKLTKETFMAVMRKLMESPFKPTVVSLPKLKLDSSQNLMDILERWTLAFSMTLTCVAYQSRRTWQ